MRPTLEEVSAALLGVLEGIKLTAYQDSGGVWTNGIGNTLKVVPGSTITMEQATADFARNQASLFVLVRGESVVRGAAMISFGFNCGIGNLEKLIAGTTTIDDPVHTTDRHGTVLNGLVARRRLEKVLYDSSA